MRPEDETTQVRPENDAQAEDQAELAGQDGGQEGGEEAGEEAGEGLLELVLAAAEERKKHEETLPPNVDGVVIGHVMSVDADGTVRVTYPGAQEGVVARVMTAVKQADTGREAALLFEGGDREKPVVMGLLFRAPRHQASQGRVDGERIVFSAEKEIVLECGDASITLTRAGKILIKGKYVLSRSSGTNRIQGGSVQIN